QTAVDRRRDQRGVSRELGQAVEFAGAAERQRNRLESRRVGPGEFSICIQRRRQSVRQQASVGIEAYRPCCEYTVEDWRAVGGVQNVAGGNGLNYALPLVRTGL